tara:strand:- start:329 stop:529 length:201 start_codon:yes stop_codon:yes gene_type:complete
MKQLITTEKKMTKQELINEIIKMFNNSKNHSLENWEINKLKKDTKEELQRIFWSLNQTRMFTNNLD